MGEMSTPAVSMDFTNAVHLSFTMWGHWAAGTLQAWVK